MEYLDDVQDPSDFPIDSLRKLDSSLRCPICKELFDGPVILRCGHTFCSLCIRNVLPGKPECPKCRAPAKELHIVRNATFEEAIIAWSGAREQTLQLAKNFVHPNPPDVLSRGNKRKFSPKSSDAEAGPSKLFRRGSDQSRSMLNEEEKDDDEVGRGTNDEEPLSSVVQRPPLLWSAEKPGSNIRLKSADSTIACPVCERDVKYNLINQHIDSACKKYVADDAGNSAAHKATDSKQKATWHTIFNNQSKKASGSSGKDLEIPATKLAKVSYGTMTTNDIRKLLGDRGLPALGERQELIQRHQMWVAIYNANLDRSQPKTVGSLKHQLKEMEDAASRSGPKKLQDEKEYTRKHSAEFALLIEKARPKAGKTEESFSTIQSPGRPNSVPVISGHPHSPSSDSRPLVKTEMSPSSSTSADSNVIIID